MRAVQSYAPFFQEFNGYFVKVHASKSQYVESPPDDLAPYGLIYNLCLQASFVITWKILKSFHSISYFCPKVTKEINFARYIAPDAKLRHDFCM